MNAGMVLLTPDELRELVREAVREIALAPSAGSSVPSDVLNREQVAKMLSVNPHHVPKLVKQGMPVHMLGKMQRFLRNEVLAWIAEKH